MSRIGINFYTIKSLGFALVFFLSPFIHAADLGPLPFDHRRLLLVQMDQTQIPSSKVLSQILDDMRIRGRYQWVLASRPGEPLEPVRVPRDFSWDSPPSVQKMAQRYKVDGLLWIQQRGQEILIKWYDGKEGMPLVFESTFLRADVNSTATKADQDVQRVSTWISSIWARFPGQGFLAKRDSKFVYLEGSQENDLKAGDLLKVVRVTSVTRHNLFKTIAEFKTSHVGQVKVVAVDKLLARAEVIEESSLDPLRMGDRYELMAVQEVPVVLPQKPAEAAEQNASSDGQGFSEFPSSGLGAVTGAVGYGKTNHQEKTVGGEDPGLQRNAPSAELQVTGHITTRWVGWLEYRFRWAKFTTPPDVYELDSIGARFTSLGFHVGHRFMLDASPDFWVAPFLGYRGYSFTAADDSVEYGPTSKKWHTLALGVHLRFPFDDKWGLRLNASKSMFIAYSEQELLSGGTPKPSAAEVGASLWLNLDSEHALGAGFRYQVLGASYTGAGTRGVDSTSTSLKISELLLSYESRF
jgi:hypothetical protein